MARHLLEAIATLVGTSIGAGILGIPYVVAKAGFGMGLLNILTIGFAILAVNLLLGEVVLRTDGKHQMIGYAEKYLGKPGRIIMVAAFLISIYGALLAYTAVEGEVLHNILGLPQFSLSLIFFAVMAALIFLGLEAIEESELLLVALKVMFFGIMFLLVLASGKMMMSNLQLGTPAMLFIPYGVVLFAFLGFAAIPEMREELEHDPALLKRAIIFGSLISLVIYVLFTLAVVAVNGINATPVAPTGLAFLGRGMVLASNLFAVLAMATSFLALGLALKEMYQYDFGLNKHLAWLATCIIPLLGFLAGFTNFIALLGIVGALAGGIEGILIVMIHWQASRGSERAPEYKLPRNIALSSALVLLFILGIAHELLKLVGMA